MFLLRSATSVANHIRHRSRQPPSASVTNHSTGECRVTPALRHDRSHTPRLQCGTPGLYEQLCLIHPLPIVAYLLGYLWKSHAFLGDHLSVQITLQLQHHRR
jgi:hypothetical protein